MTKEQPILFSGDMVWAILGGRKSQMRRVCKKQPIDKPIQHHLQGDDFALWRFDFKNKAGDIYYDTVRCPYGVVGDRLWVRETWACGTHMGQLVKIPKELGKDMWVAWKENYNDGAPALKQLTWKSACFMPKWAARIWLEITNIRVERLQQMNAQGLWAEGMEFGCAAVSQGYLQFEKLWNSLNAKRGCGWDKNPWIWAIEFKRLEKAIT